MAERCVPNLPSRNLRESLSFYESIGFENRGAEPEDWDYLIVGRGQAEIHFSAAPTLQPLANAASCYLFVDDAPALHAQWVDVVTPALDSGSRIGAVMDTAYGMSEFAVVDPSGNLVRVGSPVASEPSSTG